MVAVILFAALTTVAVWILTFIGLEVAYPLAPDEAAGALFGRAVFVLMTTPVSFIGGCIIALVLWRTIKLRRARAKLG